MMAAVHNTFHERLEKYKGILTAECAQAP